MSCTEMKNIDLKRSLKPHHLYILLLILGIFLTAVSVSFFKAYYDLMNHAESEVKTMGVFAFFGAIAFLTEMFIAAIMYFLGLCTGLCGVPLMILSSVTLWALHSKKPRAFRTVKLISISLIILIAAVSVIYAVKLMIGGNAKTGLYLLLVAGFGVKIPVRFISISNEFLAAEEETLQSDDDTEAKIE